MKEEIAANLEAGYRYKLLGSLIPLTVNISIFTVKTSGIGLNHHKWSFLTLGKTNYVLCYNDITPKNKQTIDVLLMYNTNPFSAL